MYFGFLIPKFKRTLPLDIEHLKIIGFKQGLQLIHQFIDFIGRIHESDHMFGFIDFQNLFFIQNEEDAESINSKTKKKKK
mgnify:CR=1 FL=1